jgi:hypothetical protein
VGVVLSSGSYDGLLVWQNIVGQQVLLYKGMVYVSCRRLAQSAATADPQRAEKTDPII